MKLKMSARGRHEIERLILITSIGLITSLQEKAISIEQAEQFLYSPYTLAELKKINVDNEILDIILRGCELEDIESLMPERLEIVLQNIKSDAIQILYRLPNTVSPTKKWIDSL